MVQYIPLNTLVTEIERRIKVLQNNPYENHKTICHLDSLKQFIDTLEVKQLDLEKEIQNVIYNHFFDLDGIAVAGTSTYATVDDMAHIAKHFFELGLKA